MSAEQIKGVLNLDPFQFAEMATGQSYKNDQFTSDLGVAFCIVHNEKKTALLLSHDDSIMGDSAHRFILILGSLGFKQALDLPFEGNYDGPITEHFFVFAHPTTGVIVVFDTFGGKTVNSSHMYYRIKLSFDTANTYVTSSGSFESESEPDWRKNWQEDYRPEDLYWAGYHDGREAIRYHYNLLKSSGTFLNPWPKDLNWGWTDLNLMHYKDWRDIRPGHSKERSEQIENLNNSRIELLPDWVKAIINRN